MKTVIPSVATFINVLIIVYWGAIIRPEPDTNRPNSRPTIEDK